MLEGAALTEDQRAKKKVIIAGYYGHRNAGDEAILHGILTELRALNMELEFVVISGNPEDTEKLHSVKSINWKDFASMIEEVKSASLVIVGGGGLIQDYWGVDKTSFLTHRQGGITEYGSPIILAKLFGIPSMFYAVGVGPLNTQEGREYTRILFEAVNAATVRDEKSRKLLTDIGIQVEDVLLVHDPAIYAPEKDLTPDFSERLSVLPRPLIGVSVRYWGISIEPQNWQPKIAETLDLILERIGGSILFMPFHISEYYLENDQVVCEQILREMVHRDQTQILEMELDPLERFSTMSRFDFVLGMRLHAIVAAVRAGLPCIGIEYDPKVRAFMDRMALNNYCFNLSSLDPEEIADRTHSAYKAPTVFKEASTKFEEMTASISKSAQLAREILEKPAFGSGMSPLLVDFVVNLTLNVTQSEEEKIRLNEVIREIWAERLDPSFSFEVSQTDLRWIERQLLIDHDRIIKLEVDNKQLLERAEIAEAEGFRLEEELHEAERDLLSERMARGESEEKLQQVQLERWELKEQLSRIEHSKGYKILLFFWKIIWRFRDPKQTIIESKTSLQGVGSRFGKKTSGLRTKISNILKRFLPAPFRHLSFVIGVHHLNLKDDSTVTLYAQDDDLFPDYEPRTKIVAVDSRSVEVTLVTTVKNEEGNAQNWLEDLERQNRVPDEVVLLEGGSSDRTYEIIESFAGKSSLNIRVYSKPDTNIATRRNLGVELASHPVIVMTDFGCTLKGDWLEKMLIPFLMKPSTEVVAGGYEAQAKSRLGHSAKYELIPPTSEMSPQSFLPACRSIAFRKTAWETVGGFPEWLSKTGEDTYFDIQLKRKCPHWAFVPEAQVIWHAPETLKGIWDKLSSWTVGDGESGAFVQRYWDLVVRTFWGAFLSSLGLGIAIGSFWILPILGIAILAVWCLLHLLSLWGGRGPRKGLVGGFWRRFGRWARVDGFLRGVRNRPAVMARKHADVSGVVLFLSGVPIDDTGGGARGTQIALELLRRGNLVIFVHKYPKQESIDLKLDFDQPNLLHFSLTDFDWKAMKWELRYLLREKPLTAILEFPFKEFLPIAKSVEQMGGEVVYDLIDEWNTSLGGDWYSGKVEQKIIKRSDILIASAPSLVERMEEASGREVLWLPNAVNLHLFDRDQNYYLPEDLSNDSPKILYIGALWGEWFDWTLLQKIAQEFSGGSVTIIGDYRGQCPFTESNLFFLGLKPQRTLPAYLQHSDVAIIPWKISPITQATSPLKIFEYLAMGTPVVAPKLNPLEGIPYVFLAEDHQAFLENIERARSCMIEEQVLEEFLHQNSWQSRIDKLAEMIPHFKEVNKE